jgi:hypothetical protein
MGRWPGGSVRRYPPIAPRSAAGHWSPNRDRAAQARFRRYVLANAGYCCQYQGCAVITGLQAHHTQAGNDDPQTGLALCRAHHRLVDLYAR